MLFTPVLAILFPAVALAAPAAVQVRGGAACAPVAYTLSDFVLSTSATAASVGFSLKSTFDNVAGVDDAVMTGASCHASGTSLPNNNECDVKKRKLLFDLAGPQDKAQYHITHTWVCNGATWMSGNDVTVRSLTCTTDNGVTKCTSSPQIFVPQNVRQICSTPTC